MSVPQLKVINFHAVANFERLSVNFCKVQIVFGFYAKNSEGIFRHCQGSLLYF